MIWRRVWEKKFNRRCETYRKEDLLCARFRQPTVFKDAAAAAAAALEPCISNTRALRRVEMPLDAQCRTVQLLSFEKEREIDFSCCCKTNIVRHKGITWPM